MEYKTQRGELRRKLYKRLSSVVEAHVVMMVRHHESGHSSNTTRKIEYI